MLGRLAMGLGKISQLLLVALLLGAPSSRAEDSDIHPATLSILFTPGQPLNRFIPEQALGAGIDGHAHGETARQLSTANIAAMRSAGLKPLAYRLRTELGDEVWHWNPRGEWSDAAKHQGYWTSSSRFGAPIKVSYGYRLPRRGNTRDQANDDGYSRLDDGNTQTFWKSNPYLDEHYTHEKTAPPQWVIIDLGAVQEVNAIKIAWGQPFAQSYQIELGVQTDNEEASSLPVQWQTFPQGEVLHGVGGAHLLRLAATPLQTRFVRILLSDSSHTAPATSHDLRDRLGFAIREIYVGALDGRGRFVDVIRHGVTGKTQTQMTVSSTDPWHRAMDKDRDTEQPGFDYVFHSGLTNGMPVMMPVPVLYNTPDNAAAEIQYLDQRGYAVGPVELGEEPDGQFVTPEHFGALYRQYYQALHAINPSLRMGGPSMQDIEVSAAKDDIAQNKAAWLGAFLNDLRRHDSSNEFSFFSFEWYPFTNDCQPVEQLLNAASILTEQLQALMDAGLTHDIPWIIAEYGYSAFGERAEVDLDGALLNADSVARFLALGGNVAYLYGYEPGELIAEEDCSAGNNMLFFQDDDGRATQPSAAYWGARLLTQTWGAPGNELHELYPVQVSVAGAANDASVSAYALQRLDGQWAVLVINKNPEVTYRVTTEIKNTASNAVSGMKAVGEAVQYSRAQYQLNADPFHPFPIKDEAPLHLKVDAEKGIVVPPYSMTVLVGGE